MLENFIHTTSGFFVSFYEVLLTGLTFDFAIKLGIIYALIIWLACIIWVIKDITNRSTNILVQVIAILLVVVLTPIFGLPVYLLIRPRTTLFEQYYEETSLEAHEGMIEIEEAHVGLACPECHGNIESNHKFCPHCRFELMVDCIACKAPTHVSWTYCAACGQDQTEKPKRKKDEKKKTEPVILSPEPLPEIMESESASDDIQKEAA